MASRSFPHPSAARKITSPVGKNITISREEVDKRMTSPRIKVTAGPHEVGFTFIDRPTQEQNMWQPVLRDSLEAHNPSRHPETAHRKYRRSLQCHRHQRNPGPQAALHLQAGVRRKGSALRSTRSCPVSRAVPSGGPSSESDIEAPMAFYQRRSQATAATSMPASARDWREFWRVRPSCSARKRIRPDLPPGAAHRISDLELASRLSFFLWSSIPGR